MITNLLIWYHEVWEKYGNDLLPPSSGCLFWRSIAMEKFY